MKLTLFTVVLAGVAAAAPAAPQERDVEPMERRQWGAVIAALAPKVVSGLVGGTVAQTIINTFGKRSTAAWAARGDATQQIVDGMKQLDPAPEEAAVCALHGGFELDDESHQRELATVELSDGAKKEDYDCFFLGGPANLTLTVDNLPINIAIQAGPCSFENGVLSCS